MSVRKLGKKEEKDNLFKEATEKKLMEEPFEPYVFIPKLDEVVGGRLRLRYSAVFDMYFRDWEDDLDPNTTNVKHGWKNTVFSFDGVERIDDNKNGKVYLSRSDANVSGTLSWKFDFSAAGLVVDFVTLKIDNAQGKGGQVSVKLIGDSGKKCVPYLEGGKQMEITKLDGCSVVTLSITLTGDSSRVTKLLEQNASSYLDDDFPLDINIRLRRPNYQVNRSLILLGLMYSTNPSIAPEDRILRAKPRSHSKSEDGCLFIHVQQAKRLPHRLSGTLPHPSVKCNIVMGEQKSFACKTDRIKKTLNPAWDEHHQVEDISIEELKESDFEVLVMHSSHPFGKRREFLGKLVLGCKKSPSFLNTTVYEDESEDEMNAAWNNPRTDASTLQDKPKPGGFDFNANTSDDFKLSTCERSRSLSTSTLMDEVRQSIYDMENRRYDGRKRRSWGKIFSFGISDRLNKKRKSIDFPTIVVSNSMESFVLLQSQPRNSRRGSADLLGLSNTLKSKDQEITLERRSRSWSSLVSVTEEDRSLEKRRTTLTPVIDKENNMSKFIDSNFQSRKANDLASSHWKAMLDKPDHWIYCWHPLMPYDLF